MDPCIRLRARRSCRESRSAWSWPGGFPPGRTAGSGVVIDSRRNPHCCYCGHLVSPALSSRRVEEARFVEWETERGGLRTWSVWPTSVTAVSHLPVDPLRFHKRRELSHDAVSSLLPSAAAADSAQTCPAGKPASETSTEHTQCRHTA